MYEGKPVTGEGIFVLQGEGHTAASRFGVCEMDRRERKVVLIMRRD